jgi:hypothetical protein
MVYEAWRIGQLLDRAVYSLAVLAAWNATRIAVNETGPFKRDLDAAAPRALGGGGGQGRMRCS